MSINSGPRGFLALVGFKPKIPQHEAGIRIDPPPSLALAMATIPELTAAADPPLEPPGVRLMSHGLWVGPKNVGSVVGRRPNSGVFVLPNIISPAFFNLLTISVSSSGTKSLKNAEPSVNGTP